MSDGGEELIESIDFDDVSLSKYVPRESDCKDLIKMERQR